MPLKKAQRHLLFKITVLQRSSRPTTAVTTSAAQNAAPAPSQPLATPLAASTPTPAPRSPAPPLPT